jgi:hypothetical protein
MVAAEEEVHHVASDRCTSLKDLGKTVEERKMGLLALRWPTGER